MKKHSCTACGFGHSLGYLFDNPSIRICLRCRDVWLTFLKANGFTMDDRNDLVNELCEDSHAVAAGSYRYYDSLNQVGDVVLRLRK
jgi:hypothetical protein